MEHPNRIFSTISYEFLKLGQISEIFRTPCENKRKVSNKWNSLIEEINEFQIVEKPFIQVYSYIF